jgi:hypothetical protein
MGRAAEDTAGGGNWGLELAALQWVWREVYQITDAPDGGVEAWRSDGSGCILAETPAALRQTIREDYPKYAAGTAL